MKLGGDTGAPAQTANPAPNTGGNQALVQATRTSSQGTTGNGGLTPTAQTAPLDASRMDPTKMTPQQMADVMDAFNKLPRSSSSVCLSRTPSRRKTWILPLSIMRRLSKHSRRGLTADSTWR